jgi:dTDP-4-amino-4,6-dideoxygalactose transaminase
VTPIHHTFGPFVDASYLRQSFHRAGPEVIETLRAALAKQFKRPAFLFSSGREALLALLRAMELRTGKEIIVQGFTCAVVPNAIHAAGGSAVYADIDRRTLNLTPETVRAVLTPRTRAVICQHTFGIPADAAALRALCDDLGILLIEDCAHVIADDESPIGRHGDAVLLSFGRDKAVSGVTGGAVLTADGQFGKRLQALEQDAAPLSLALRVRYRLYPLVYAIAKLLWPLRLGKIWLRAARLLRVLPSVLTASEKRGLQPTTLHALPPICAALALFCLKRLPEINTHRRHLALLYRSAAREAGWMVPNDIAKSPAPQKVPLLVADASGVIRALKKRDMYLDDGWRGAVVNPPSVDQASVGYRSGSCPVAEEVAGSIVSLPTHPTMSERSAKRLIQALAQELSGTLAP